MLDRFGQIRPRVLFAPTATATPGKEIDSLARVREVRERIPEIERVVVVPYLDRSARRRSGIRGRGVVGRSGPADCRRCGGVAFASACRSTIPLYIMYSSGTTGLPKCMVHGAGGTLLQHLKELVLHTDLSRDDRIFYFTTCGWMMWNWLVSSLAVGATVVLYDGAPLCAADRSCGTWRSRSG